MLTIEHINIIGCLNFIYPPTHPLVMISHFTMEDEWPQYHPTINNWINPEHIKGK